MTASESADSPISVVRDKLITALSAASGLPVAATAGFAGNELMLTSSSASADVFSVTVANTEGGGKPNTTNTISVSQTGIEAALRGFESSLQALAGVTGAIGDAVDIAVNYANTAETHSANVSTAATAMASLGTFSFSAAVSLLMKIHCPLQTIAVN